MRMRRGKSGPGHYEVEVFTKGILRVSGKRRVDLHVRVVKDIPDREILIYNNLLRKVLKILTLQSISLPVQSFIIFFQPHQELPGQEVRVTVQVPAPSRLSGYYQLHG